MWRVGGFRSQSFPKRKVVFHPPCCPVCQALCIHGSLVQMLQREADDVSFRQRLNVSPQNPSSPPFCSEPNPLPGVQADVEAAGLNQIPNDGSFQTPLYTLVHMRSAPRDSKTPFLCKTKFKLTF